MIVFTTSVVAAVLASLDSGVIANAESLEDHGPITIITDRVMVAISQDRKVASAYSFERGAWSQIDILPLSDAQIEPMVVKGMVAFTHGTAVYAYSSRTGQWDRLVLPKGRNPAPMLTSHLVRLQDGDVMYVFGENAHVWTAIDLRNGRMPEVPRKPEE